MSARSVEHLAGLMELHVIGISGSPRVDGNTDIILREALGAAKEDGAEVELIRLCDYIG